MAHGYTLANLQLAWHLGFDPRDIDSPVCHGYQNACVCELCKDRQEDAQRQADSDAGTPDVQVAADDDVDSNVIWLMHSNRGIGNAA